MPPTDKAKAAGVSVSSFFDLKAELVKKSDEFARTKAAGGSKYVPGEGRTRPDKVRTHLINVICGEQVDVADGPMFTSCSRNQLYGPDRTRVYMVERRATWSSKK